MHKNHHVRRALIPIDYVEASPDGGRRSRRLYDKQQRAAEKGRTTAPATGGSAVPVQRFIKQATCQGCGRAAGELTENGCPTCGPDATIR